MGNYDPSLSEKKNEPPAPPTKAMRLRESSLLGSMGMLRVLGGVYRNLREAGADDSDIPACSSCSCSPSTPLT